MVEAHETADVGLFWKFLVWMQHVSNSTDSAALVLIAKHRDVVYIGLLGVEVNVTTALRFVISMCIYVPHATSTSETEMVASFKKIHTYCLHLEPWVWCVLCDSYFNLDSQLHINGILIPKKALFLERYAMMFCVHDSVLGNQKAIPYFPLSTSKLTNFTDQ